MAEYGHPHLKKALGSDRVCIRRRDHTEGRRDDLVTRLDPTACP